MLCFHGPLLYEAKVQNPFSFKKLVETTGLIVETTGLIIRFQ